MKSLLKAHCVLAVLLGLLIATSSSAESFRVVFNLLDANPDLSYSSVAVSGDTIYGTTYEGGSQQMGTVFKVNTDGTQFGILKTFSGSDGQFPMGNLVVMSNTLYGTTQAGGVGGAGVIYKIDLATTNYMIIRTLNSSSDGYGSYAGLVTDGTTLYGDTFNVFNGGQGSVFKINPDGGGFQVLKYFFGTDGAYPKANLVVSNGVLYGTTSAGSGSAANGTVFKVNTGGGGFSVLRDTQAADGTDPYSPLILSSNILYGTAQSGGTNSGNYGTVFKVGIDGNNFAVLKTFNGDDGANPFGGLAVVSNVLYGVTMGGTASGFTSLGTVFKLDTDGGNFTTVHKFIGTDGEYPFAALTLSSNQLYGITQEGGSGGSEAAGTVFAITVANSSPVVTNQISSHALGGNQVQLDFFGAPGANYILQETHSLKPPLTWTPIATNAAGSDGSLHFTNSITSANTYWRIHSTL